MPTRNAERRIGAPPPATDLGLRRSLLWRLAPAVRAALPRSMDGLQTFSGQDFIEQTFAEIAAIEARVNPIWALRVTGPALQRPQLNVVTNDLRLQAEISMARDAPRPELRFALGTALALDDLALFALSLDGVLARDRLALDRVEIASGLDPEVCRASTAGRRFVDYDGGLGEHSFHADRLTFDAPDEPSRLLQANLLSELMLAFVLLHERAHYGLGHLDLMAVAGAPAMALSEIPDPAARGLEMVGRAPATAGLPRGARRVLEFQADTQAYYLLCAYALSKTGPCRRYERLLTRHGLEPPPEALSAIGFGAGLRLCLTAAALACLAFQLALPDAAGDDPSHPSPQARLMNLMVNTPILSPLARLQANGEFVLEVEDMENAEGGVSPDFATLIHDVFSMALADLQLTAAALGPSLAPLQPNETGDLSTARWIADLGAFWISDDETLNTVPQTAAGQEIWSLRGVEMELDPRLRAFQAERFGEVMQVEVGGLDT